jgi:hypothetical protein
MITRDRLYIGGYGSMGRPGPALDNAIIESWHSRPGGSCG